MLLRLVLIKNKNQLKIVTYLVFASSSSVKTVFANEMFASGRGLCNLLS